MLKVRTVRHRPSHIVTVDDGQEVEVQFEPIEYMDMHAERIGDKLVVAYLARDLDPYNPMDSDCQGSIYTIRQRFGGGSITDDDSEVYSALCINSYGGVDRDLKCTVDGHYATLAAHAADQFMREQGGYDLAIEWMDYTGFEHDREDEDLAVNLYERIWQDLNDDQFKDEEIDEIVRDLYMANWREIVGPRVVPLHYCSSVHGPGTTTIGVANWDGDPDDLPDGVWVAGRAEMENIEINPLPRGVRVKYSSRDKKWVVSQSSGHENKFDDCEAAFGFAHTLGPGDVAWAAELYAESICEEYQDWCNGDVYGCVVETFVKVGDGDDEWERIEEDACWGFIGSEYAEQTLLDEFFKPAVEAAKKEVA